MLKGGFILLFLITTLLLSDEYCQGYKAFQAKDFNRARQMLDPLAFKGNTKAQNLLGLCNFEESKFSTAQKWLQSAAAKGDAKAAYNLGVYYYIQGDQQRALKWMHQAESLTQAKVALGVLYADRDTVKAKSYLSAAAKEGQAFARAYLCAIIFEQKRGQANANSGLCPADAGEALFTVGKFYTSPKQYGSIDKAIHYLTLAAQSGHAKAMNLLGETLYKRRGPSDEEHALAYYLKASSLGNVDAKVNAAWIYYVGKRWTRKPKQGFAILDEAYKQGDPKAQFYMGILKMRGFVFSGETVNQDIDGGLEDIKAAAAKDDPQALEYLIKNYSNSPQTGEYQQQLESYYKREEEKRSLHFLYDAC